MNRKRILLYFTLVLLLTIGVPLLINLSYSLPFVIIRTKWGASEVLNYYSSLLEISVTVVTFLFTIHLTLAQIRHEQDFQQELKMWQETEEAIDLCLDEIHPLKLQYAFLEVIAQRDTNDAFNLIGQIRSYSINATVSVDKMSRTLTRMYDADLKQLTDQIILIRDKLISIADRYQQVYQQVMMNGMIGISASDSDRIVEQQKQFAEQILELEKSIQDIYQNKYLTLIEQKYDLFRSKYTELSQKKPRLI